MNDNITWRDIWGEVRYGKIIGTVMNNQNELIYIVLEDTKITVKVPEYEVLTVAQPY